MMEPVTEFNSIATDVEVPVRSRAPDFGSSDAGAIALERVAEAVRSRFGLDEFISQADLVASLTYVMATSGRRQRWIRAFGSPLGRALIAAKRDLNTTLAAVLALVPTEKH